jgi:cytoskeletal protein CcmA (bactofilin family)
MSFLNASPSVSAAGTAAKRMWYGIYTASVVSIQDPLKQSRVTLKIPQVLGTSTSNWAVPVGFEPVIPSVNQMVWAMFLGGDINHPLYIYASTSNSVNVPGLPVVTVINNATVTNPTISGATLTTSTLTSPTITSPTVTGGTYSSPTISTPTVTSPTITGGTISSATSIAGTTVSASQVLINGAIGAAQLEIDGTANITGAVGVEQLLVNGGTGTAQIEVNGSANIGTTLEAQQVLINGATGTAALEVDGDAHITGNLVPGEINGTTIPQTTVSTVASAPGTNTASPTWDTTYLDTLASAINGLISRLQSVGIIS